MSEVAIHIYVISQWKLCVTKNGLLQLMKMCSFLSFKNSANWFFYYPYTNLLYCWLVRVTLVVGLVFLPQNFGPVVWTYKGVLLFCECIWGGDSTWRWWGHLNTTCRNWTCLNFLHWEVMGIWKPNLDCPHTPAPLYPCTPCILVLSHPLHPHTPCALIYLVPLHPFHLVSSSLHPCALTPLVRG